MWLPLFVVLLEVVAVARALPAGGRHTRGASAAAGYRRASLSPGKTFEIRRRNVPQGTGFERFEWVTKNVPPGARLARSSAPHYQCEDCDQQLTPESIKFLKKNKIKNVISLNGDANNPSIKKALKDNGISYTALPIEDFHAPTVDDLNKGYRSFMAYPSGTIVWCGYGHGRTGTMISALQVAYTQSKLPLPLPLTKADFKENHVETFDQVRVLNELQASIRASYGGYADEEVGVAGAVQGTGEPEPYDKLELELKSIKAELSSLENSFSEMSTPASVLSPEDTETLMGLNNLAVMFEKVMTGAVQDVTTSESVQRAHEAKTKAADAIQVFTKSVEVVEDVLESKQPASSDSGGPAWLKAIQYRMLAAKVTAEQTTHSIGNYISNVWTAGAQAAAKKMDATKEALEREQALLKFEIQNMKTQIKSVLSTLPGAGPGLLPDEVPEPAGTTAKGATQAVQALSMEAEQAQVAKHMAKVAHESHVGAAAVMGTTQAQMEAQAAKIRHMAQVVDESSPKHAATAPKAASFAKAPATKADSKMPAMAAVDVKALPKVPQGEPLAKTPEEELVKKIDNLPRPPKAVLGVKKAETASSLKMSEEALVKTVDALPSPPKHVPGVKQEAAAGDGKLMNQISKLPNVPKEDPGKVPSKSGAMSSEARKVEKIKSLPSPPKHKPGGRQLEAIALVDPVLAKANGPPPKQSRASMAGSGEAPHSAKPPKKYVASSFSMTPPPKSGAGRPPPKLNGPPFAKFPPEVSRVGFSDPSGAGKWAMKPPSKSTSFNFQSKAKPPAPVRVSGPLTPKMSAKGQSLRPLQAKFGVHR